MILILSDIHLADTPERRTIDIASLCDTIKAVAAEARSRGVDRFTVLLLGDIFEILKSQRWQRAGLRPWDDPTPAHDALVRSIFDAIVRVNRPFFDTLLRMQRDDERCQVIYVPGNHDWPINGVMGEGARRSLVAAAGLRHDATRRFSPTFNDVGHALIASHGHEHDPANRTEEGKISLGDAIVVDVLLALPLLVGKSLGDWAEYDPRLHFLHELDNVRPQSRKAMAAWLMLGTERLAASDARARAAVKEALQTVAESLRILRQRPNASDAWQRGDLWISMLTELGGALLKSTRLTNRIAAFGGGEESDYSHHARNDLAAALAIPSAKQCRFVAYGHTHLPVHAPLGIEDVEAAGAVYLNTGTWRRVHRLVEGSRPAFIDYEEETYVILHSDSEALAGAPRYQFRRVVRG